MKIEDVLMKAGVCDVLAQKSDGGGGIEIFIKAYGDDDNEVRHMVLAFDEHDDCARYLHDPALIINHAQAQVLIDQLWQCGVRPAAIDKQKSLYSLIKKGLGLKK
jgi:hypothetical protein